jgi:predicted nucleic acid-binding Zn ribbon protein
MSSWRPSHDDGQDRPPRPVRESLGCLARRLGAPDPPLLTAVFAQWEELVGPAVAAHARPLSLARRVLVVGVDHPGWATQLRYLAPELLGRLAATAGPGQIERVEIKVVGGERG